MRLDMVSSVMATAAVLVASAAPALGDSYTVSPDGLGDFPTIQAAVDAAGDGDFIYLTDGTFTGDGNRDIVVPAVSLTIESQSGVAAQCFIDCQGSARAEHRAFHFTSTGSGSATLSGVGIMNGYVVGNGAGIWVEGASPQILHSAAVQCVADGGSSRGGGLYVSDDGAPAVAWCIFSGNSAHIGGGIAVYEATGSYQRCDIIDNEADTGGGFYGQFNGYALMHLCDVLSNTAGRAAGVRWAGAGSPAISLSTIARNETDDAYGGGIWLQSGSVTSCTIVENRAATLGGGVYCQAGTGTLTNCLIAYSENGYGVAADEVSNAPTMSCCDVYGNLSGNYDTVVGDQTGVNGNISQDPHLCGIESGDYALDHDSPCLPEGNGCAVNIGSLGQGCDTPVEPVTWGRLKGMYR